MKEQCKNIFLYIDDELNEVEKNEFETHLANCQQCTSFLQNFGDSYKNMFLTLNHNMKTKERDRLWEQIEKSLTTPVIKMQKWLIAAAIALMLTNLLSLGTLLSTGNNRQNQKTVYNNNYLLQGSSAFDEMIFEISETGGDINE